MVRGAEGDALPAASALSPGRRRLRALGRLGLGGLLRVHLREHHPDLIIASYGAELSALVQERCFYKLEAPIQRVTGYDTPYPHSLEWEYFPTPPRIIKAMRTVIES